MPNSCLVCGHTKGKDGNVGLHRFPKDKSMLHQWLKALNLKVTDIRESSRVCSRNFPNGDISLLPSESALHPPKNVQLLEPSELLSDKNCLFPCLRNLDQNLPLLNLNPPMMTNNLAP